MKRLALVAALVIIVGIVAFYASRRQPHPPSPIEPQPTLATISAEDVPALDITPVPNEQRVEFLAPQRLPEVPKALPVYRVLGAPDAFAVGASLAQALRLTPSPSAPAPGVRTWRGADEALLQAQSSPPVIAFQRLLAEASRPPTAQQAQTAVETILTASGAISADFGLRLLESDFLKITESNLVATSSSAASVVGITLRLSLNGLPFFQDPRSSQDVTAQVASGGLIRALFAALPPRISSGQSQEIFSPGVALVALQNGKGSLVSIQNNRLGEASIVEPSFTAVQIASMELAYLLDKKSNTIEPVYVFRGVVARGDAFSEGAAVLYLVSATRT